MRKGDIGEPLKPPEYPVPGRELLCFLNSAMGRGSPDLTPQSPFRMSRVPTLPFLVPTCSRLRREVRGHACGSRGVAGTDETNGFRRGPSSGYRGFLPLGKVVRTYCSATELPGRDPLVELKPEGVGWVDD